MREDYFYLGSGGGRVFAAHHRPVTPAKRAAVFCHPLGEEKLWAHRAFVSTARRLAAEGIAVLRFDFRGEGDSDLSFEDTNLESRIADTNMVLESVYRLEPTVEDVTLVGLRLGAAVAAAAAAKRDDVSRLVLWDPVVDGAAYMQAVLRLNLMFQMAQHRRILENRDALALRLAEGGTVNIEGYELSGSFFQQVSGFRLQEILSEFKGRTVLVRIDQADTPSANDLTVFAEANPDYQLMVAREEPFWRETRSFCREVPELTRVTLCALEPSA